MALTKYTYSIQDDTPNHKVDVDRLTLEITTSDITIAFDHIETIGDELNIWFKAALSSGDQTLLTTIVNNHSGEPLPDENIPVAIKETDVDLPVTQKGFINLDGHIYFKKGVRVECAADGVTNVDVKFDTEMNLCGGGCHVMSDQPVADGDYVEFFIVDKDNLLGYGLDTVLCKFIETDYIWAGKDWEVIFSDAKPILEGLYLRISYNSTGTEPIVMYGWFNMRG